MKGRVKAKLITWIVVVILFLILIIQNAIVQSTLWLFFWKFQPRTIVVILISGILGYLIGVFMPIKMGSEEKKD